MTNAPLTGRIAVVTGGGRGLGYAMASAIARAGASVALLDQLPGVSESAERLTAETGAASVGLVLDVTDADAVAEVFVEVEGRFGTPDALVNAAGVANNDTALEVSPEVFRRVIDINLTGTFLCCQAFARRLTAAGQPGAIVNIASMSGMVANRPQDQAAYNASKAGVSMLTSSLAVEWLPLGIRVNAISPGYFASDMTKSVSSTDPEMYADWMARTPAGRMGRPDELGPLAVYLLGDDSAFIVGQSIVIDGGYTQI